MLTKEAAIALAQEEADKLGLEMVVIRDPSAPDPEHAYSVHVKGSGALFALHTGCSEVGSFQPGSRDWQD